jgi:hypothetical protein
MGLALATLLVGAGLFATAIKQHNLNEVTAAVVKFFAKVMVVLFVVSFVGEMVTKSMEFYMKLHPPDPYVNVTIDMPPLNAHNYKDYGQIEINAVDFAGKDQPTPVPANQTRTFIVHNGTQFHIDLDNLTTLLLQARKLNLSQNEITIGDHTAGAGEAK